SFGDLERLERIVSDRAPGAADKARAQEVLLRVTPGVAGAPHQAMSTGQVDSKFGFSIHDAAQAIARLEGGSPLKLVGLHCHIGSQLLELDPFGAAIEAIAELGEFPVYNLGGGLGAAYTSDQRPPEVEEYVQTVVAAAHRWLGRDKRL